jgi:signal transduction histidine kinase
VNIWGSRTIGLSAAVLLILLGIVYAAIEQHFLLYLLTGVLVIASAAAATFWFKRLEGKAIQLGELDVIKSEFVSRVSHELRTPLTTIKALTRLMLRGEISKEKQREYLETISIECDRQIDLVLNLLDLSRIEGGVLRLDLGRVEVADIISSCVKAELNAAERRGHELQVGPIDGIPAICADSKAMRRILGNLIENSVKYTADGGSISVFARSEADSVDIMVMDNGRGIPPEDLPVLFDKFHRGRPAALLRTVARVGTKEEFVEDADVSGVGLGLYVVRDLMNRMGGEVTVETEVGKGTTFRLKFPVWVEGRCGEVADVEKGNR